MSEDTVTKTVTIKEGTTTKQSSSHGGSSESTISATVGGNLKDVFSAELGYSKTTGFDWSFSSESAFSREVTHQATVPVRPGAEVSVYQVVGVCDNSDGTVYTVNTKRLVVRGSDGSSKTVDAE